MKTSQLRKRSQKAPPKLDNKRLHELIDRFPEQKILVMGDLMLDRYIMGTALRLSPEAPVPVLNMMREKMNPGGAGNVAANIRELGAGAIVVSVTGNDQEGNNIAELLEKAGVDIRCLIRDSRRPTTMKTRVIAGQQQLVRIDREYTGECDEIITRRMARLVSREMAKVDGLIISDYDKGTISSRLLSTVIPLAVRSHKPVVADPKRRHFNEYKDVSLITPNISEASSGTGIEPKGEDSITMMGRRIISSLGCQAVLITKGEQGMTLFEGNDAAISIPARVSWVYDVTGAGDTVSAVATLALATGATNLEAAVLANIAAGIVVRKPGVALVTTKELVDELF